MSELKTTAQCGHTFVDHATAGCGACLEARAEAAERERDEWRAKAFHVSGVRWESYAAQITAERDRARERQLSNAQQTKDERHLRAVAEAALEKARCLVDEWAEHPTGCQFLKGLPCDCWISKVLPPPAEPVRTPERWKRHHAHGCALIGCPGCVPEPVRTEGAPTTIGKGHDVRFDRVGVAARMEAAESAAQARTEGAPKEEEPVRTMNAEESAARKRILARLFVPMEPPKQEEPDDGHACVHGVTSCDPCPDSWSVRERALRARVAELEATIKIWRESAELRAQECPECTAVAPSHKFSCSRMGGGQLVVSVDRVVAPEAPVEKETGK